jgi:hypothetical protein
LIYRVVYPQKAHLPSDYVLYPNSIWYHRMRATIIETYTGRETFVHELQLEPWGPGDKADQTFAEQNKSMSARQIERNIEYAKRLGMDDIYLWGGEWWYWRMQQGDSQIWETVRDSIATNEN